MSRSDPWVILTQVKNVCLCIEMYVDSGVGNSMIVKCYECVGGSAGYVVEVVKRDM